MERMTPLSPSKPAMQARERLIVALDLPSAQAAREMVDQLDGVAEFFKIGLTLQLAPGVESLIHDVLKRGKKVFLDYKYYDIAETLKKTVARAAELGVHFLTVHGTSECVKGAVAGRGSGEFPKIFAVTVLTSHDKSDLIELGYTRHEVSDLVLHRARMALNAGCDGVIASGQEASVIKALSEDKGKSLLVITPGIRPDGYPEDDQKRVMSAKAAVLAGADYLVVGRPITKPDLHANPREATQAILAEMQGAYNSLGA